MTIGTLLDLFTETYQQVEIFDIGESSVVFTGDVDEIAYTEYWDVEIMSIDTLEPNAEVLTINIDTDF